MAEKKESIESAVRTIRRVTRIKQSAEEKVRIILAAAGSRGYGAKPASPPCRAGRRSPLHDRPRESGLVNKGDRSDLVVPLCTSWKTLDRRGFASG